MTHFLSLTFPQVSPVSHQHNPNVSGMSYRGRKPISSAFTLVELLVVIGIIGILVGILMPALSSARKTAQATKCAANLRQIGQGWMLYANRFGGVACPMRSPTMGGPNEDLGNGTTQYRPRWFDHIGVQLSVRPYDKPPSNADDEDKMVTNRLFICPTEPERANGRNFGYGYNFQFLGNPRTKASGRFINFPVRVSRLKAATTIAIVDSMGTAAGKARSSRRGYLSDGSSDLAALGNHGYTVDPPRLTALSDYSEDNARSPADRSAPEPRHRNLANALFCDGHVEAMSLKQMGYIENQNGSVAAADPQATNQLFSGSGINDDPPSVN